MQNVHLKFRNDESHCPVSAVELKLLDVSPCSELLLLPMIIKKFFGLRILLHTYIDIWSSL